MAEERFPNLDEVDAERHIAAITGEAGPLPQVAERPSLLRRGFAMVHDLGKIAINQDMRALATALRRTF